MHCSRNLNTWFNMTSLSSTQHDVFFMKQALEQAEIALSRAEFPVGCVLVSGDEVIAKGRRHNSEGDLSNEIDHAEVVTLRSLLVEKPTIDCASITAYSTMEPCLMCYSTMLLSGIRRFVWAYEDVMGGGTALPLSQVAPLYANMEVVLIPSVLREQSLTLFYKFFEQYSYWQNSLLEEYTKKQYEALNLL
jgi:tRNA(adenine34) deaminase